MSRPSTSSCLSASKDVDARDKPGHDDNYYQSKKGHQFDGRRTVSRWQLPRLRRIVEEPLAKHTVAAPFLQRDFVEPAGLAGMIDELEYPVYRDAIALDHRGHAGRRHALHAFQHRALMRDQDVAADARRRGILLHAGVLGVEALDRAGMIAGDDGRNELIETGARGHERPPV